MDMHFSQTDGTAEEHIYSRAWPSCEGTCSGTNSATSSPTKSPTNSSTFIQLMEQQLMEQSVHNDKLPLMQFFDDPGCNQANSPQFYGKWGCNKVEALGGSMLIKQCAEKLIYDWHWRLFPDYECLSSTFQVTVGVETRKCHKFPLSNIYWKVCCGSCGLTAMEIAFIVCSVIICLLLVIGCFVCYKKKKCCFNKNNQAPTRIQPGEPGEPGEPGIPAHNPAYNPAHNTNPAYNPAHNPVYNETQEI